MIPTFSQYFFEIGRRWLYILLLSCCLSGALTPFIMWVAVRLDIVDVPGGRKIHERNTPLLGGLSIIFAFNASLFANMILDHQMLVVLAGGIIVAIFSVIDDWRDIPARWKLLVQLLVVAVMIREGIVLDLFPHDTIWGFWLNSFLTVMWIVGITNSMNFIDGMDGLAAGVAAIISMFLGIVAYQTGQSTMGWVAIAMLGSCLGFMPYNFGMKREAGIFLGDTGSTFIGFVLAAIAVKGEWAVTNNEIASFSGARAHLLDPHLRHDLHHRGAHPLTSESMNIIKNSSVAFPVSIAELTMFALQAGEETSRNIEMYLAVTVAYFLSAFAINRVMGVVENRVRVPGMIGSK